MPYFQFPCHYVFWSKVEDHENIKKKVLPTVHQYEKEIGDNNTFKAANVKTNFSNKKDFLDEKLVNEIVWKNLQKMIEETNCFLIQPKDFIITEYWFNTYELNNFQEMHHHSGPPTTVDGRRCDHIFSMIYILHSEEEQNSTIFKMDDISIPFHPLFKKIEFNTGDVEEIKEGSVIIFSSSLQHAVLPVKVPGRATIAFNIGCFF